MPHLSRVTVPPRPTVELPGCDRLQLAFDQAPGMLALLSGPGPALELLNRAFSQFLGPGAWIGKTLREVFPELDEPACRRWMQQPLAHATEQPPGRLSVRVRRNGHGGDRVLELILQPLVEDDGATTGVLMEAVDLTEHQRTEDELREREQRAVRAIESSETERSRLDALLEAAPVGIIMADVDGRVLRVNAENRRIWGAHPLSQSQQEYGQWKGWWADDGPLHGQRLQAQDWAMSRALRGEEQLRDIVEIEAFGQPPVRRTIVNSGAPVRDAEGRIIGAVVAQMDITDRVKAEMAARENEAKLRTITEAMPQMVWSALPDGTHDYFNSQWCDYTGLSLERSIQGQWLDGVHPQDHEHALVRWRHSLATGQAYDIECQLRHHSGAYRWSLVRALPVRDAQGRVVRWMGTCTDIHEHKMAQQALLDSDRRKDEFLAMLAHELRNPLAPISAAAELLARGKGCGREGHQLGEVIQRHVAHMSHLVDDLLDVSRVTRGRVTLARAPVDVRVCLQEALEQVRPLISSHAHRLHTRLQAGSAWVLGEKKRLVQVMANLLSNAAKYTPRGGCIEVELGMDAGEVVLTVRDDGIGMSPELLAHAFDLFTQGERSSDRSEGGLGIGLALVRALVQLHGGQVHAYSAGPGLGSMFTVRLPRLDPAQTGRAAAAPARHLAVQGPGPVRLRIMVVDDNQDAGQLLGVFLRTLGHEVQVYSSGPQALAGVPAFGPQVGLLDIGLPGMDGLELARRLRQLPGLQGLSLAAVTGYGQARDRQAARDAGFDRYFVKPLDMAELEAWLEEPLRSRAAGLCPTVTSAQS